MTPGSISEDAFQQMLPDNHPFKHVVLQAQEDVARACEKSLVQQGYEKKNDEDYDVWHKRLNDTDSDSTGADGYRTKYMKSDGSVPKWETDTRIYKDGYPLGSREAKQEGTGEYQWVPSRVVEGDKEPSDPFERQVGGDHYKDFKIQPSLFCEENELEHYAASMVTYACRYKKKGGFMDLEKIIHYAEMAMAHYYPEEWKQYKK